MKVIRVFQIGVLLSFGMCSNCFSQVSEPALETITVEIPNVVEEAIPLKMVLIPAGTFTMGSSTEERRSDPKLDHA